METDIVEGNKIIADFEMKIDGANEKAFVNRKWDSNQLHYHSDWNLLMNVVEKIESLGCYFSINGNSAVIWKDRFGDTIICEAARFKTKRITVWQVVMSFAKWYNKSK